MALQMKIVRSVQENLKPENFKDGAPKHLSVDLRLQVSLVLCRLSAGAGGPALCCQALTCFVDAAQDGYDHSYFTMSTFIDDHIAFHAAQL